MVVQVYCFGNPLLKDDRLPFELLPQLRKEFGTINFIEASSPDDIEGKREVNIIDTAKGIPKVTLITDVDAICSNKTCSLHDFDLGMTLKLMKKMGNTNKVRIFAVPQGYKKGKALAELKKLIKKEL